MLSFTRKQVLSKGVARTILSAALIASSIAVTTSVHASGSFGGGGNIGSHNSYNLGKSLFHKKLICNACPANGTEMNKTGAKKLIKNLQMDDSFASNLNAKKREAVIAYLTRRFKVN